MQELKSVSKILLSPKLEISKQTNKYNNWEKIDFKNVSFKHEKSSKIIMNNINLTINRGETIGIQGTTGSGKSTFADLLSGLLIPTSGIITTTSNKKIKKSVFNDPSWFKEISYLPQKIFLLDTLEKALHLLWMKLK